MEMFFSGATDAEHELKEQILQRMIHAGVSDGALRQMRREINPTPEERAEDQARELEAQRRHDEVRKSHTARMRQRRRDVNAAFHR
jgi:hypothetical protein